MQDLLTETASSATSCAIVNITRVEIFVLAFTSTFLAFQIRTAVSTLISKLALDVKGIFLLTI